MARLNSYNRPSQGGYRRPKVVAADLAGTDGDTHIYRCRLECGHVQIVAGFTEAGDRLTCRECPRG